MTMLAEPTKNESLAKRAALNDLNDAEQKLHQEFPSEKKEMQGEIHLDICMNFVMVIKELFALDAKVAAGGDVGFYWNNEDDRHVAAPDAYLVRNAGKEPRKSWKLWEERAAHPNLSIEFLLEVWSDGNSFSHRINKFSRYQLLGAKEFFQLDYLEPVLLGHRLNAQGIYGLIEPNADGRLQSVSLGAEIAFEDGLIRLYRDGKRLLTLAEAQSELGDAEAKLGDAEAKLDAERLAKEAALAELEQLKKQLGRA
jgi:Uma2 family endonuclease